MSKQRHRYLIAGLFLLLFGSRMAAFEEIKTSRISNPRVYNEVLVKDDKYYPPISTLAPWYTAYNACNMSSRSVLEFGMDETMKQFHANAFSATLYFDAIAYDKMGNPYYYYNQSIAITYDPAKGTTYTDKTAWVLNNMYMLHVTVKKTVTMQGGVQVPDPMDLYLEARIHSTRDYEMQQFTATQVNSNMGSSYLAASKEIEIHWPVLQGVEAYDLEWCWSNSYNSQIPQYDFRYNATRIRTPFNYYRIPDLYEKGAIMYRVRPVGKMCNWPGTTFEGKWANEIVGQPDYGSGAVYPGNLMASCSGFESDKFNWVSTLTFDENGKQGAGADLCDGLMKPHYSIARSNTDNVTISSSTLYDFQGRPAVQVLPAPLNKKAIEYTANMNLTTGSVQFDKNTFDPETTPCVSPAPVILNTGGASAYFSTQSFDKEAQQALLPDAGQYPYIRTEYTPDLTGRIRSQNQPGEAHKVGSDKETKYFYSNPGSRELDRLFGTEAGTVDHYKKNSVRDANGQLSVSYLDMQNHVVATALAGQKPTQVSALADYATRATNLTDNLLVKNKKSDYELSVNTSILIDEPGVTQQFVYELTPRDMAVCPAASNLCLNCIYEMELSVKDECGNELVDLDVVTPGKQTTKMLGLLATNPEAACTTSTKFTLPVSPLSLTFPTVGNYIVTKKLRVSDTKFETYWRTYKLHCLSDSASFINTLVSQIDASECGFTCAQCSTAVNNFASAHSLSTTEKNVLLQECGTNCANDPCEPYRLKMLHDLTPSSNTMACGQYAQGGAGTALSIFGGSNSLVNYVNVVFHEADGTTVSKVYNTAGTEVNANQLSVQEFIDNFRPSWAMDLLPFHPEYCYLQFCQTNSASLLYDQQMMQVNTYDEACSLGLLKPLGAFSGGNGCTNGPSASGCSFGCGSSNPDPFFTLGLSGYSSISLMQQEINTDYNSVGVLRINNAPGAWVTALLPPGQSTSSFNNNSTGKCAYYLAASIVAGASFNTSTFCFGGNACDKNKQWRVFRGLYLSKKLKLYENLARENAIQYGCLNECIGTSSPQYTYPNTCNIFVPPNKVTNCSINKYNPSLDASAVCSSALSSLYANKTRNFFTFTDMFAIGPQAMANSASGANTSNPILTSLAGSYLSNCTAYAEVWMNKLVQCDPTLVVGSATYNNIKNNLIGVCAYGSDSKNPSGVSAIISGGTNYASSPAAVGSWPGSYSYYAPVGPHYNTFQQVLTAFNFTAACPDLFTFPPVQVTALPATDTTYQNYLLGSCACSQIMDNNLDFATKQAGGTLPSTVTTAAQLWNYNSATLQDRPPFDNYDELSCICSTEYGINRTPASPTPWNNTSYYNMTQNATIQAYQVLVPSSIACCTVDPNSSSGNPGSRVQNPVNEHIYGCNTYEIGDPCLADMLEQAYANGMAQYQAQLATEKEKLRKNYKAYCLGITDEKFERTYVLNEFNYTLYYYDNAGNLVRTVPPAGVKPLTSPTDFTNIDAYRAGGTTPVFPAHEYPSLYSYNSRNASLSSLSPDEDDRTEYVYDYSGRIIASQNATQRAQGVNRFSYTNYDGLGRIVEAGEVNDVNANFNTIQSLFAGNSSYFTPDAWAVYIGGYGRINIVMTTYDVPASASIAQYFVNGQNNLRNRVSAVQYWPTGNNYDFATYFSYDIHGNVVQLVQENPGLIGLWEHIKTIEYEYDLVSGNVNRVIYQRGKDDQVTHKYYYDADNRLHEVLTSKDNIHWDRDAKYFYYKHGPLARVEVADGKVNGLDYAYTIHGWLKGMNSAVLDAGQDMGKDSRYSTEYHSTKGSLHGIFAKDAAGFTLNYFDSQTSGTLKDYQGIRNSSAPYVFTANEANLRTGTNNFFDLNVSAPNLYNGNISSMTSSYLNQNQNSVIGADQPAPQVTAYNYDQLNRLKQVKSFRDLTTNSSLGGFNSWNTPTSSNYDNSYLQTYSYDNNGNITSTTKNGATALVASGLAGLPMDNMTYTYGKSYIYWGSRKSNRLIGIADAAASGYADDSHQNVTANPSDPTKASWNYDYDGRGNLILDKAEHIANIVWTHDGKIQSIVRDGSPMSGGSYPPNIDFLYDANRQRVVKIVKPRTSASPSPQNSWIYTYYVRDAQGQIMTTYEKTYQTIAANTYQEKFILKEYDLYGSKRLGTDVKDYQTLGQPFTANIGSGGGFTNINVPLVYIGIPANFSIPPVPRKLGKKLFEHSNHLGNVLATTSDRKVVSTITSAQPCQASYDMQSGVPAGIGAGDITLSTSGGQLVATRSTASSWGTVDALLGTNIPSRKYRVDFDFDPGTLTAADKILIFIYEQNNNVVPATLNILPAFQAGSYNPPLGHYNFTYTPVWNGPGIKTYISFRIHGAVGSSFKLDNVSMCEIPGISDYNPDVLSHTDYYAFGQTMPGRTWQNSTSYRYGFNGKENDNEVKGAGNQQDYGMRIYDPRISRFLSVDPLAKSYPELTPYQFASNRPIDGIDIDGGEWMKFEMTKNDGRTELKTTSVDIGFTNLVGVFVPHDPYYTVSYNGSNYSFNTIEALKAFAQDQSGYATDAQSTADMLINTTNALVYMHGEAQIEAGNAALSKGSGTPDQNTPIVTQEPNSSPNTTAPKGMNNPKVRAAVTEGKAQHKILEAKVQAKGNGWKSEPTYKDPKTGKLLYPDVETPSGNLLELKPKTESGMKKGAAQTKKYEEATGKKARVIYYTPQQKKPGS